MIEREQMVLELRERLEWLEQNASEKDDYASEAEAIRQFLKKLELPKPNLDEEYFSPQEAMKRFWGTYETRMEIDHERQKILTGEMLGEDKPELSGAETDSVGLERNSEKAGKLDAEGKETSGNVEKGFFWYLARHKRFAVAAVALMVVLVLAVGGTVGAYAQSQMGIFSMFKKDEEGLAAVVNPEKEIKTDKDLTEEQVFLSIDELPENYKEKFKLPATFNDEYYIKYITIMENFTNTLFRVCYCADHNINFYCYQRYFNENETYFCQSYDDYILKDEEIIEGTKVCYYQNEKDEENRYIADFYIDDNLFIIVCKTDVKIIKEFMESILKK